jgi:hypothetical protein
MPTHDDRANILLNLISQGVILIPCNPENGDEPDSMDPWESMEFCAQNPRFSDRFPHFENSNQLVDDDNWIDLLLENWLFIIMTALGCFHPSLDKAIFICAKLAGRPFGRARSPDQDGSAAICAVSEKDGSPKWTYSLSRYDSKGYNLVAISARESQLVGGSTNLEHEKNWRTLEWLLSGCILAREIQKSHLEMMFFLKPSFVVVFHGFPHISL